MGRNNIGLHYKYNVFIDAFHYLGFEFCKRGVHPTKILEIIKQLYPELRVAKNEVEYVRATLSDLRVGRIEHRTTRMRTPELFVMLSKGRWTLKEYEERRLIEAKRAYDARIEQEGRQFLRQHLARERGSIAQRFKLQLGDLSCEACGFNFEVYYGELGRGFIEAHHTLALREGPRQTCIKDFRAVCSNCHRMIHRKGLITVEQVREIVIAKSAQRRIAAK